MNRPGFLSLLAALLVIPVSTVAKSVELKKSNNELECVKCRQVYLGSRWKTLYSYNYSTTSKSKEYEALKAKGWYIPDGNSLSTLQATYACDNCWDKIKPGRYQNKELIWRSHKVWFKGKLVKNRYGSTTA